MKKLIVVLAIATTIGVPTVALSFEANYGARNPYGSAASARAHSRAISRHSYAMSPRRPMNGGYSSYDNTGGGSPGYNEMLLTW